METRSGHGTVAWHELEPPFDTVDTHSPRMSVFFAFTQPGVCSLLMAATIAHARLDSANNVKLDAPTGTRVRTVRTSFLPPSQRRASFIKTFVHPFIPPFLHSNPKSLTQTSGEQQIPRDPKLIGGGYKQRTKTRPRECENNYMHTCPCRRSVQVHGHCVVVVVVVTVKWYCLVVLSRSSGASAATRVLGLVCVVAQLDLVGELVVHLHLRLLRERVPRDRLERLLHVDRLLRARLEVGNVAERVAPLLCLLRRDLLADKTKQLTCTASKPQGP